MACYNLSQPKFVVGFNHPPVWAFNILEVSWGTASLLSNLNQKKEKKKNKTKDRDKAKPEVKLEEEIKQEAANDAAEILLSIKTSPKTQKISPKPEPKTEPADVPNGHVTVSPREVSTPSVGVKKEKTAHAPAEVVAPVSSAKVVAPSPTQLFSSSDSELEGKLDSSLDQPTQKMFVHSGNLKTHHS